MRYLYMLIIGFGIGDFLTALKFNEKQSYRFHVKYPLPVKYIDDGLEIVASYAHNFDTLQPQNYFEFVQFWQQFARTVSSKQEKLKAKDEKALQLKQEIKEVDEKLEAMS